MSSGDSPNTAGTFASRRSRNAVPVGPEPTIARLAGRVLTVPRGGVSTWNLQCSLETIPTWSGFGKAASHCRFRQPAVEDPTAEDPAAEDRVVRPRVRS